MTEEKTYQNPYAPTGVGAAASVASAPVTTAAVAPAYAAPAPVAAYAGTAAPAVQEPKKKNTGYVVAIVILSILLLLALGVAGCSMMTAASSSLFNFGGSGIFTNGPTVAVIDIDGTIEHGGGACSPEGLAPLLKQAEAGRQHQSHRAARELRRRRLHCRRGDVHPHRPVHQARGGVFCLHQRQRCL